LKNSETYKYAAFIDGIDQDTFYEHKKTSRFFWPKGVLPSAELGGMENVENLIKLQLIDMLERENYVMGMKSILPSEAHESFHDFRKSVRAILLEVQLFGSALVPAALAKAQLDDLHILYKDYGKVNDKWTEYDIKRKHGGKGLEKLEKEIEEGFDKIKKMQQKMDLPSVTTQLMAFLPPACAL